MQQLRTEFPFTLPKGFVDADGVLHRDGTMRLATARDELEPLNDPKVDGPDSPYLAVIVLSRVVTRLGTHSRLSPRDVEGLFAADLAYLQDVYGIVNYGTPAEVERFLAMPQAPDPVAGPPAGMASASTTLPTSGSPISDAARGLMGGPAGAPATASSPAPDEPDDVSAAAAPRSPRRGRIEEVGKSTGRPGSAPR